MDTLAYWITAVATVGLFIVTGLLVYYARNALNSWKSEVLLKKKAEISINTLSSIEELNELILDRVIYTMISYSGQSRIDGASQLLIKHMKVFTDSEFLFDCFSENYKELTYFREFCGKFIKYIMEKNKLPELENIETDTNTFRNNYISLKSKMKEVLKNSIL